MPPNTNFVFSTRRQFLWYDDFVLLAHSRALCSISKKTSSGRVSSSTAVEEGKSFVFHAGSFKISFASASPLSSLFRP